MITITKTFTFDAGHRLTKHKGPCKNLHGHTYKLEVTVGTTSDAGYIDLDQNDMIIDFKDLKVATREVLEKFDHAMILNKLDVAVIKICEKYNWKFITLHGDPTAEKIVMCLRENINSILSDSIRITHIK